jgi:hypothetical protein
MYINKSGVIRRLAQRRKYGLQLVQKTHLFAPVKIAIGCQLSAFGACEKRVRSDKAKFRYGS